MNTNPRGAKCHGDLYCLYAKELFAVGTTRAACVLPERIFA